VAVERPVVKILFANATSTITAATDHATIGLARRIHFVRERNNS
jgi:hypothetical protein